MLKSDNKMNIILPIFAASILVTAQALWKKAFASVVFSFTKDFLFSKTFLGLIFSPYFISGAFLYLFATVFYIYLFNKYTFYSIQSIMLVTSITLSLFISSILFHEGFTTNKIIGLLLLISGIVVIYKK